MNLDLYFKNSITMFLFFALSFIKILFLGYGISRIQYICSVFFFEVYKDSVFRVLYFKILGS